MGLLILFLMLLLLLVGIFRLVKGLLKGCNIFLFSKVKGKKYMHGVLAIGSRIEVVDEDVD